MRGRAGAEIVADLAAVGLEDVAGFIADRDDERAVEVLVAAGAQHAEPLELASECRALLRVVAGQPVGKRSISVAELEALDGIGGPDAALLKVSQGLGGLLQGLVVVADDLVEGGLLVFA